jgi:hypothetical protein
LVHWLAEPKRHRLKGWSASSLGSQLMIAIGLTAGWVFFVGETRLKPPLPV